MRVDVTFPRVCAVCHREFTADEEFVGRVLAGSAWKNGQAVLEEGAELFETVSYHAECVPIPAARSQAGATHKPGADIENPRA